MLVSLRRERVKEIEEMLSVKFTEHQHLGMWNSDFNALLELSPNNIKSQCTIPNAQSNLHCISYNNYFLHSSFFFSICDFCEVECKSPSELEVKFAEMELEHLFKEHIQPLL